MSQPPSPQPLPGAQLKVDLPYPPTANNAFFVSGKRLVKTDEARNYATSVQEHLMELRYAHTFRKTLSKDARFAVRIIVRPPDRRRRDLANTEKLVVDAVFNWLGADDCRIDHLALERADRVDDGQLEMTITPLDAT